MYSPAAFVVPQCDTFPSSGSAKAQTSRPAIGFPVAPSVTVPEIVPAAAAVAGTADIEIQTTIAARRIPSRARRPAV